MKLILLLVLLLLTPVFAETTVYVPAVQQSGATSTGVLATLTVDIKPGTGHVFVDTEPLTEIDTQSSARIAKEVLEDLTNIDMDNYDLFFTMRSDAPIIGGPSAGGAMTAAAIADFFNLSIDKGVVMTGTINPDGSIGAIGGVFEKAEAVSKYGRMFLVPEGQGLIQIQKTERTEIPGMVKIVSRPVTINIIEYAKEKWDLDVEEISDIKEAVKYMTGFEIKERESGAISLDVKEIMKNMSASLINYAKDRLEQAELVIQNVREDYRSQLQEIVEQQKERFSQVEKEFSAGSYYSASSRAFVVSIYSSYVVNFAEFLEKGKNNLEDKIINSRTKIDVEEKLINNTPIDSIVDIEIIAAAKERLADAETNVGNAFQALYSRKYSDAVYYVSYLKERIKTAENWMGLTNSFSGDELNFSFEQIKELAQRRIEDAAVAVIYASTVGVNIAEAEQLLEKARADLNDGIYSSALFNAVMAKAQAEMEMEIRGVDKDEKIKTYRKKALDSIEKSQSAGAIPILAISYLEYGESFIGKDTDNALLYLKYAKGFADVSANLKEVVEGKSFEKEIGVDIIPVEKNADDYLIIGLVFLIGLIAGAVFPRAFKV
jgi:uncharacterized protein